MMSEAKTAEGKLSEETRKYEIDTHTHTLASGHAYNTIDEMTREAAYQGVKVLGITDHAPKMPGSCSQLYFSNLHTVRRKKYAVERLMGCELNVLNENGKTDLPEELLKQMDLVIASLHIPCIRPGSIGQNTAALVHAMENPYIHIIGHPDDGRYPLDYEALVAAAKSHHKLLELNNSSLKPNGPRAGARENDIQMLKLCRQHDVCISLGSDAHIAEDICNFQYADALLQELDFPDRLVANRDRELLFSYLNIHCLA